MQGNQNNAALRSAAKAAGVYLWEIAALWGISEATMTRIMRKQLPEKESVRFMEAVQQVTEQHTETK